LQTNYTKHKLPNCTFSGELRFFWLGLPHSQTAKSQQHPTCAGQKKTEFDILRLFKTEDEPIASSERKTEPKTHTDAFR